MNFLKTFIIYCFIAQICVIANAQHKLFVSPEGKGNYTEKQSGSLNGLNDRLRDLRRQDVKNITVYLKGGYIRVQDNVMTDLKNVDLIKEQHAGNASTPDNLLINNNTQDREVKEEAEPKGKVGVM